VIYKEMVERVKLLDGLKLKDIAEKITNISSVDDRVDLLAALLLCERWKCSNEIFKNKQRVEIDYEFLKKTGFAKDVLESCIAQSQSLIQDYSAMLVFEKNGDKSIEEWKENGLDCSSIKQL